MSHTLLKETVNLHQLPVNSEILSQDGIQITIGDLHANAIKLIFMLIKHGIIQGMTAAQYQRLVEIYQIPAETMTKDDLDDFKGILNAVTYRPGGLIRLLGDELADRGSNDMFILLILQKLDEHTVPIEILVSNHGMEFIVAYEQLPDFRPNLLTHDDLARSMSNLQLLITRAIVTRDEVLGMIEQCYKPNLKVIAYSVEGTADGITLYSHAPIGFDTLRLLAQRFSVNYVDTTLVALMQTLDRINQAFQSVVQANQLHQFYNRLAIMQSPFLTDFTDPELVLEHVVWNRRLSLMRPNRHSEAGYMLAFAHGHHRDGHDRMPGHIYNLDNYLGQYADDIEGEYTVLCHALTPALLQHATDHLTRTTTARPIASALAWQMLTGSAGVALLVAGIAIGCSGGTVLAMSLSGAGLTCAAVVVYQFFQPCPPQNPHPSSSPSLRVS